MNDCMICGLYLNLTSEKHLNLAILQNYSSHQYIFKGTRAVALLLTHLSSLSRIFCVKKNDF